MLKLLAIGEVMAEIRSANDKALDNSAVNFAVNFAGDSFNTAIYAARYLNQDHSFGYMTRIGTEPLSDGLMALAKSENLYLDAIARDSQKNIGIYSVTTDAHGERSFHYWRSDSAARTLFTVEETALFLPAAEIIYLSGISLAILTPAARERLFTALEDQRHKMAVSSPLIQITDQPFGKAKKQRKTSWGACGRWPILRSLRLMMKWLYLVRRQKRL